MGSEAAIRPMTTDDHAAIVELARGLPEFFNEQGIAEITEEIPTERGAVAEIGGAMVGFVTWRVTEDMAHISWIGVSGEHHREGIGRRLVGVVEDDARRERATVLQVETLGESVEYEPYDRTRAFYRSVGFVDHHSEMLDNPGMPEMLTLRKDLTSPGARRRA